MAIAEHNQTEQVPHARYTASKRKAYGAQQEVAEAWAEGKYPTHNNGVLYSSPNFRGEQNNDGTGRLMHYRTREAIRTRNGLIISNSQCWSAGFAHCSAPRNTDGNVPLTEVERYLEREHDVYDITRIDTAQGRTVVEIDGGAYGIAFGRDSTITNGPSSYSFKLTAEEIKVIKPTMVDDLLLPDEVAQSNGRMVTSREFTKTRLTETEAQRHESYGGKLTETARKYGEARMLNRQHFRANLQGNAIVRQGEWFFIPIYKFDLPFTAGDRLPKECADCGATRFEVNPDGTICKECGHLHVDGFGDLDRRLGNHRPREAAYVDSETYVRGTVRHENNDHHMIHLGETWHKAVTHDRDVRVFGTRRSRGFGRGD